jgi:hypothetical protein
MGEVLATVAETSARQLDLVTSDDPTNDTPYTPERRACGRTPWCWSS